MKKIEIKTNCKKMLSDIYTPVGIYLRLRDRFRDTILLESTDYHAAENSTSFICINAIAGIEISDTRRSNSSCRGRRRKRLLSAIWRIRRGCCGNLCNGSISRLLRRNARCGQCRGYSAIRLSMPCSSSIRSGCGRGRAWRRPIFRVDRLCRGAARRLRLFR
jgi:hypothetical protein